jgi:hypothetical protein
MDNESQRYKILAELKKYVEANKETMAYMFLLVDSVDELAVSFGEGDIRLLMQGFGHAMKIDPQYNKAMKASMGLYLHNNPKEKEEFLAGLNLIKNNPNMN